MSMTRTTSRQLGALPQCKPDLPPDEAPWTGLGWVGLEHLGVSRVTKTAGTWTESTWLGTFRAVVTLAGETAWRTKYSNMFSE